MTGAPQPQASPSPEIVPALDEMRPQIGPNLASDPDLCKLVIDYCHREYVYPQVLQQQPLRYVWQQIDDAFRVKGMAADLDISAVDPMVDVLNPDGKGRGGLVDQKDGYSSRVFPATFHLQVVRKTDLHMSVAWASGLPVRAEKPDTTYEHPLYNPVTQSCEAANIELQRCADAIRLKKQDRKGRGSFAKYGHAWAAVDFEYELADEPITYRYPADPNLANAMIQAHAQQMGPPAHVDQQAMTATWIQRNVKKMLTRFTPLRVDDVFVDQTLPADDLEQQLCPCVRSRCTRASLFGNDYDPDTNPFGYLNCPDAMKDGVPQWSFDGSDLNYQQELQKKWGMSKVGLIKPANAMKEKWTLFPMLALYRDPADGKVKIDNGTGVMCRQCRGRGSLTVSHPQDGSPIPATCPTCNGLGKEFVPPKRYVVEAFGNMGYASSSATVLRIQENPTVKGRIPLLFTANLTEDTAGAIPLSKSEASMKAVRQEATACNQWFDAKNYLINPSWMLPEGANTLLDYNKPNQNIECVGNPQSYVVNRMAVDPTTNLLPFMGEMKDEVMDINGMSPGLLGEVSSGRRAATEIQNAFDAGKMPITIEIDQYGEDMLAGWAQCHLDNIEAWADRAWIQATTGRTTFGKVKLFAAVADEYLKRQQAIGNLQYLAQLVSQRPDANLQPLVSAFVKLSKLDQYINADAVMPDGGIKKGLQDGMKLVAKILGTGQLIPPMASDPDPIFIGCFEQALQDEDWQRNTPETLPLLQQRLMMQMQQAQQKQMAQLAAQQHSLAAAHMGAALGQHFRPKSQPQGGNGNQPPMSNSAPATAGGQNQQLMGAAQ